MVTHNVKDEVDYNILEPSFAHFIVGINDDVWLEKQSGTHSNCECNEVDARDDRAKEPTSITFEERNEWIIKIRFRILRSIFLMSSKNQFHIVFQMAL